MKNLYWQPERRENETVVNIFTKVLIAKSDDASS